MISLRNRNVPLTVVLMLTAIFAATNASAKAPFGVIIEKIVDYEHSHQTVCRAYNENTQSVLAHFKVCPGAQPQHAECSFPNVPLPKDHWVNIFGWSDNTPNIRCELVPPYPAPMHR